MIKSTGMDPSSILPSRSTLRTDTCIILTISINIHSAGVSLSVVIRVCLIRVAVVGAVVAAVTNIVTVVVVLPGVVDERAVVLFWRDKKGDINDKRG